MKINNLKEKIQNEIIKIDKSYEEINNKISKSYEKKHEVLIREENELKEKLQNEVTKVKEKLEIYLSELNEIIRNYEIISKGIKSLEKEEKNMIETISYISTINKNKKKMNMFFSELIKSLNISFDEEKNNIKFDEYYIIQKKEDERKQIEEEEEKFNSLFDKLNEEFDSKLKKKEIVQKIKEFDFDEDKIKEYIKKKIDDNNNIDYQGLNKEDVENLYNELNQEFYIALIMDKEEVISKIIELNRDRDKLNDWIIEKL